MFRFINNHSVRLMADLDYYYRHTILCWLKKVAHCWKCVNFLRVEHATTLLGTHRFNRTMSMSRMSLFLFFAWLKLQLVCIIPMLNQWSWTTLTKSTPSHNISQNFKTKSAFLSLLNKWKPVNKVCMTLCLNGMG